MNWFQRRPTPQCGDCASKVSCANCGVIFNRDFAPDGFKHLCPEHRKEPMERARKLAAVQEWAARNVETLYEQAQKENAAVKQAQMPQPVFGGGGAHGGQAQMGTHWGMVYAPQAQAGNPFGL